MSNSKTGDEASDTDDLERSTLCMSSSIPGLTLHTGDEGFTSTVGAHYSSPEAHANEILCRLKRRLPVLPTKEFWSELMEGITNIAGSQYALAVKRILPTDHDAPVEMPELGEKGQCFMATAFFYNDGAIHTGHVRDYKYYPYTGPCSHMKHDKVFIVPHGLADFIGDGPIYQRFAFPVDTYIGIPLFTPSGECIGHFGALWSESGMKERKLSWGFVEMALHALEDITCKRLLEGQSFKKGPINEPSTSPQVIPTAVITAAQSLKPYARSLSHELRTPMQGVVGMLDIMHATVSETLEIPMKPDVARVFKMLRENIEMVQDSSRRAVEAADNVVHAADFDLQVPETPDQPIEDEKGNEPEDYISAGSSHSGSDSCSGDRKRKREDQMYPPNKHVALDSNSIPPRPLTPRTAAVRSMVRESSHITGVTRPPMGAPTKSEFELSHSTVSASTKVTRVREHIRTVVNECLRYGGRPESAIAEDTDRGEIIEVRTRDSKGQVFNKWVEWVVDPAVPDEVLVDERDFTKLISVLLLNALKFTQHGKVRLTAQLSSKSKHLKVNVVDTGTGIPPEFMPNLFKAFSRQDDTITRQSEGLGLGLLVAKGVARRLGGDLTCVRSDVSGPMQGSEFELRVPLSPSSETSSRHSSPSRTPTPRGDDQHHSVDMRRTMSARSINDHEEESTLSPIFAAPRSDHLQAPPTSIPNPGEISPPRPGKRARDATPGRRGSIIRPLTFNKKLAQQFPLRFLVAEDNRLNRKLLVGMLGKLGYSAVYEAFDGVEAVRLMEVSHRDEGGGGQVDVILMDLWMPNMDGYEATEKILAMERNDDGSWKNGKSVKILAVTADVTEGTWERAKTAGMLGCMTKPYKLVDLEKLIVEHCSNGESH